MIVKINYERKWQCLWSESCMKMIVLVKLNEYERIDENELRKIQSIDENENELWIYNSWRWIMNDRWNELKGVTGLK